MRSKHIFVLFILINLIIVSSLSLAENLFPYPEETMTRYPTLTQTQKQIFTELYHAAENGIRDVRMEKNTKYDDVTAAMEVLRNDCPELCSLDNRFTVMYYQFQPEIATSVHLEYQADISLQNQLLETARRLTEPITGDAWQMEKTIYDMLLGLCEYGAEILPYSAYGALVEGKAVCEGYAEAFMLLLRMKGIPCGKISGNAGKNQVFDSHAWNIVRIDGQELFCDPTWDDQESISDHLYWYFNVPVLPDHQPDAGFPQNLPENWDLTWHGYTGNLIRGNPEQIKQQFYEKLRDMISKKEEMNIRVADEDSWQTLTDHMEEWVNAYNLQTEWDLMINGAYHFATEEHQRCFWMKTE